MVTSEVRAVDGSWWDQHIRRNRIWYGITAATAFAAGALFVLALVVFL